MTAVTLNTDGNYAVAGLENEIFSYGILKKGGLKLTLKATQML